MVVAGTMRTARSRSRASVADAKAGGMSGRRVFSEMSVEGRLYSLSYDTNEVLADEIGESVEQREIGAPQRFVRADSACEQGEARVGMRIDVEPRIANAIALSVLRDDEARRPTLGLEIAAHEREVGGEAEGERCRRASHPTEVVDDRRHDADAHLGGTVQRDVDQRVTDVWIGETLQHLAGKLLGARRLEARDDVVEYDSADEAADPFVLDGVAHGLEPREQRDRNRDG